MNWDDVGYFSLKNEVDMESVKIISDFDKKDIKSFLNSMYGVNSICQMKTKVIFHDPATIVCWADGTKTVVKTQNGEKYDPEKGLAMCFAKKILGNKGSYYNFFKEKLKCQNQ